MKQIFFPILFLLSINCFTQSDLKFSKAFFIELNSNKTNNFLAKDTIINVSEGKVWCISSSKVFVTENFYLAIPDKIYLYLNNQIIAYTNYPISQQSDPIWLPSGKYRLRIITEASDKKTGSFLFNAFISGIEYNIW